jgi:pyrimidine deaminase RibD-like protein
MGVMAAMFMPSSISPYLETASRAAQEVQQHTHINLMVSALIWQKKKKSGLP